MEYEGPRDQFTSKIYELIYFKVASFSVLVVTFPHQVIDLFTDFIVASDSQGRHFLTFEGCDQHII